MKKAASLTIAGCGIKFMSHLSIEAKAAIERADKLFYLVNEPAMRSWLRDHHPDCISLEYIYEQHQLRKHAYQAMTTTIIQALSSQQSICVVLEGHPTVFAQPALDAAIQAKQAGYSTHILPGISAEDYLFAELHIDPGSSGCLSYEATDFLVHKRVFGVCSHLILWQVSVIGMLKHDPSHQHQKGTQVLMEYLSDYYDAEHQVILFEGSQYPHIASRIETLPLKNLPHANISRITTLYIPPARLPIKDENMLKKLGLL